MVTVKEMLLVLDELKKKEHVWLSVKEYLETFLPEGSTQSQLNIDGVAIPEAIVIDVLGDIDLQCLEPIQEKIMRIEGAKIDGEERKPRAKRDKRTKRDCDEEADDKPRSRRGRKSKSSGD